MRPDDDGTSAFSRVTGEQPLVPHILPPSFNLTQLAIQLHQLPHELKLTRRKEIDSQILEEINTCQYVWIRIDRVKRPLEAPYQGPYKVLQRHEAVYQLLVKGKAVMISVDRLKPAKLPDNYEDKDEITEKIDKKNTKLHEVRKEGMKASALNHQVNRDKESNGSIKTKSGRAVTFKKDPEYVYD